MFLLPRRPSRALRQLAQQLYQTAVAQARSPKLYQAPYLIPDTYDGRFDSVVLHTVLLMQRIQTIVDGRALNQALFDCMFKDFEHNNRHVGVGDMSIRRHFSRMTAAFNGRRAQYFSLLEQADATGLAHALMRNVYRQNTAAVIPAASALAAYIIMQQEGLCSQSDSAIMNGAVLWHAEPATDYSRGNQTI